MGPVGQSHGADVCGVASPVVMSDASPDSMRRHTLGMVYCRVLSGMRVTVETLVHKSPHDQG
jgi:hypothetical protein